MSTPTLPAQRKNGASKGTKVASQQKDKSSRAAASSALPIMDTQYITLDDGTQIPVKIPPGMGPTQAAGVVEYLRANPQAARAAWEQAQQMLQRPGLANAIINMQAQAGTPESAAAFVALKDDPDLAHVFKAVAEEGPSALQKYWDDTELMSKVSQKMRALRLQQGGEQQQGEQQQRQAQQQGGSGAPSKNGPVQPPRDITTLHEAARWGDVAAAKRLIEAGADVNEKNERQIPALGVAVGFNRPEVVRALLDAGADVDLRDGKGSSALHYAAGYGRKEVAEVLLEAGADPHATNAAQQKPIDVAKVNGELHMVAFLKKRTASTCPAKEALEAEP